MKLPIPFLQSKKEESDYYLALILTDEKAGAVILKTEEDILKKINTHEAFFPDSLEDLSVDELISSVDKAISRAEEILPSDIQTHQTVFGVKNTWVDPETKKIKKDYLEKLKKVCNALDLTPIGFMVTTEAITHLMQEEEGAPVSAIFAEVNKNEVALSLLRGGKVIESVSSPHLESTPVTVDKLLGHFTVPVLPARIIIFQSKPDERTSQAFIVHHWSNHLPFMHVPQVTVLPTAFDMRSVMSGAATQMGFKVNEGEHEALPAIAPRILKEEEAIAREEEQADTENSIDVSEKPPVDFGKSTEEAEIDAAEASDFGFMMEQDVPEHKSAAVHLGEESASVHHMVHHDESLANEEEKEYESSRRQKSKTSLVERLSLLKLPKNFKLFTRKGLFAKFKGNKAPLIIILPLLAIIFVIIGVILFYYYLMHLNVTLIMKPNMVSQDETVTFSTTQTNDFSNNLIAAKSISTSVTGQASTPATGKKDIGDKAKGSVTVYNNSSGPVTLNSGTTVTASNGQVFFLDNNTTIASASGDVFSGTKPGTTNASVTARDIGTDGNVPSGTQFAIGGGNTVAAKNDNAFSGGTKKTVTVVSSNDLVKLRTDISKSVQDAAKQKLTQQASNDETVLPLVSNPTLENQKFDHHINDQVSQVSLTADIVYAGMAYNNSDLDDYAKTIAKQKYPQDPNIANRSVKETVSDVSQRTKDAATAKVSIQAGLLPNINTQDVISNIQHKSLGEAKNSLSSLPQVAKADIVFSPPIPLVPLLFPSLPHHISVTITSQ
ncbi:MAG TPA: hypothetical protein VNW29_07270 [Candidatus Sulfotelmatobacter sp.]|jgi:hypothetical protein|nr:hypothetical protein [Candidatus Sulfotelmatobacter sp.]